MLHETRRQPTAQTASRLAETAPTSSASDTRTPWTKEEIQAFLERERLKYQKIELPFGLSTPGNTRDQLFDIAFGDDLSGKSVLDVGSYLGAFCLEAIKRGASRAVGIELNSERIRQARTINDIVGSSAEYIQADIDELHLDERFDVCLCLNILHHLRDPIRLLYHLTDITRDRLMLEIASLGRHDRKRIQLGFLKGNLLRNSEVIYVASGTQKVSNQKFFFTPESICRILDGHMKKYWKVEIIEGELKDRFVVRADKLAIDDLVVVAGPSGSGKTTLLQHIRDGVYDGVLGRGRLANTLQLSAQRISERCLSDLFTTNPVEHLLYHYETTRLVKYNIHSFERDSACDILQAAKRLDVIIVAPRLETIRSQMFGSKVEKTKGEKMKARKNIFTHYQRPDWVRDHYATWFDYCHSLPVAQKRIFGLIEGTSGRELRPLESREQLLSFVLG